MPDVSVPCRCGRRWVLAPEGALPVARPPCGLCEFDAAWDLEQARRAKVIAAREARAEAERAARAARAAQRKAAAEAERLRQRAEHEAYLRRLEEVRAAERAERRERARAAREARTGVVAPQWRDCEACRQPWLALTADGPRCPTCAGQKLVSRKCRVCRQTYWLDPDLLRMARQGVKGARRCPACRPRFYRLAREAGRPAVRDYRRVYAVKGAWKGSTSPGWDNTVRILEDAQPCS